jgi:hypothetical protein
METMPKPQMDQAPVPGIETQPGDPGHMAQVIEFPTETRIAAGAPGVEAPQAAFGAAQTPLEQMDQKQERQLTPHLIAVAKFSGSAALRGLEVASDVIRSTANTAVAVGSKVAEIAQKVDIQDIAATGMIISEGATKFAEKSGGGKAANAKAAMQAVRHMRKRSNSYKSAFKEQPKGPFKAARSARRQEKWAA